MISVLVLTKNEEQDLPGCLESVGWSDDVVVLDSLSEDRTAEIAVQWGARVVERPFDNWSSHQNWAVQNIKFKHKWVFYIDADERVSDALAKEMAHVVDANPSESAFEVRRRDYLDGRWLKHVQASPYFVRLFIPSRIRYERLVNPVTLVEGKTGRLENTLTHHPFSKGVMHWMRRHVGYSDFEARQLLEELERNSLPSVREALFGKDLQAKRRAQKRLFYRLPARPVAKFMILYGAKRGFLDGAPGLKYATLQAIYEYLIVLRTRELRKTAAVDGTHPQS